MLTQGPTPDPKWKFKIPSFLTLPCPLYYHYIWGGGGGGWGDGNIREVGSFMLGYGWSDKGWVSSFFYVLFSFSAFVNSSVMPGR